MEQQGTLIEWNDARGFGYIAQSDGRPVFVHISAFERSPRPVIGHLVRYATGPGRDGRPTAIRARIITVKRAPARRKTPTYFDRNALRVWMACALMVLVFATLILDRAPLALLAAYGVMGAVSYGLYWADKRAALARQWRRSENALHLADFAFGIIGGLLAQQVFRHKTSKPDFAFLSYAAALLHAAFLAALLLQWIDLDALIAALG